MRISTSLNVFDSGIARTEAVRRCAAAGFVSLDMNYWDYQKQLMQTSVNEEEAWAREIRDTADSCGVRFTQMHGPVHGTTFTDLDWDDSLESFERMLERSLRTAHILGVPWVVFHPANISKIGSGSRDEIIEFNARFYKKFVPILEETGVGIALENNCLNRLFFPSYFALPEDLIELIDTLNHPLIGACWDTGHGIIESVNQKEAIVALGKRLKATHIQDNNGKKDQHLLPYQGSIDWKEVVQALVAIGYEGDFTYETHNSVRNLPDEIRDAGLRYSYELGNYVLSLGKQP
ncbi:sugar phosphate isomerase/epimerase [Cohnella sp. WQ 127256]|uniref:sugar phosphate isomerase/epimerase family protein n=1 Tax=Cohnella sp. WQ 127256 TaxID=2938790 RepID=UPI0021185CD5|nr:sugar phosphate isomerase/epimerase [Cohnella sp. WQ 127256]